MKTKLCLLLAVLAAWCVTPARAATTINLTNITAAAGPLTMSNRLLGLTNNNSRLFTLEQVRDLIAATSNNWSAAQNFAGNVTGGTLTITNLNFGTNQASDHLIDFTKAKALLATNNAVTFDGCVLPSGWETKYLTCLTTITNTAGSGAPKLITMAASFQNMNASQGNSIYVTNVLKIGTAMQFGEGTNFWWVGR